MSLPITPDKIELSYEIARSMNEVGLALLIIIGGLCALAVGLGVYDSIQLYRHARDAQIERRRLNRIKHQIARSSYLERRIRGD